jgi:hypothetical protein
MELPEIFSRRVDLPEGGHADILRTDDTPVKFTEKPGGFWGQFAPVVHWDETEKGE